MSKLDKKHIPGTISKRNIHTIFTILYMSKYVKTSSFYQVSIPLTVPIDLQKSIDYIHNIIVSESDEITVNRLREHFTQITSPSPQRDTLIENIIYMLTKRPDVIPYMLSNTGVLMDSDEVACMLIKKHEIEECIDLYNSLNNTHE